MNSALWVSKTGLAAQDMRMTTISNNLANVNTVGFKADMEQARSMQITGEGFRTRFQAQMMPVSTDLTAGAVMETGRDLDLTVSDKGFIAVLDADGNEAYTRAGELQVSADGALSVHGFQVQGGGGGIQLPEFGDIDISADGTINLLPVGGGVIEQDERIKLVNSNNVVMVKGDDGLFRAQDGNPLDADPAITVRSGTLEGSNVNAVEQMVNTMNVSRQFELNIQMMKTADELAASGNKLISA